MSRALGDLNAASLGQKMMTRTIQCPECGIVLNVPDSASGRKLKCPKCATKFAAPSFGPADSVIAESSPASTLFPTRKGPPSSGDFDLLGRVGSSGSMELPTTGSRRQGGSSGDIDLPSSPAPLRDTFDLPLLGEASPKSSSGQPKAPSSNADALALFKDEPKSNRKPTGAEARSKARRCPDCGGVVGVGMSLCNVCGLDLDTGRRVETLDVFEDEMPTAPREEMPPLGVLFVGSLAALANLVLALVALVGYSKGQGSGMLCLMVVWLFGIYASVQFLRRKAIRPLFMALGLGVAIGSIYLIALPIWEVNVGTDAIVNPDFSPPLDPDAPQVRNIAEQLDMNRISWGIAILLGYAALSVYLNSPAMKRRFTKK